MEPQESALYTAGLGMFLLGMKTLSQRALAAFSTLFTAGGLFSAWWLWQSALPAPTTTQLVGLGMYAAFLLLLEFVRRR